MLIPVRDLTSSRNTRPSSHADQFTHHLRAVLPCLRSVRTRLSRPYSAHTSPQTKPLRAIKSAFLRSARRTFHAHGIPLRPLSKQARRSASSHSRCRRAAPSTSAIHVARHALNHRPRRSVPSLFFNRRLTKLTHRRFRAIVHPARRRARGRRCRALSRFRSDGRIEYGCNGWRRVDVYARKTYVALVTRLLGLYDLRRCGPFCLGTGTDRDTPGNVLEQRCAPAARARGTDLIRAACGRAA